MNERWDEMDDMDLQQMEAEMQGELSDLREAATVYADRAWARGAGSVPARPARRMQWRTWAAAGVAAAAVTVGGVRLVHRTEAPAAPHVGAIASATEVRPGSLVSDEALLEQIQNDLSSGIPAAMEPLQASDARSMQEAVKQ